MLDEVIAVGTNMNLEDAIQSAEDGNFVSNAYFTDRESMHGYEGNFYYEDGACMSPDKLKDILSELSWAKSGWFIKFTKEMVDREKLKELHKVSNLFMVSSSLSYEDAIINK